jgi:hypothetical protein
LIKKKLALLERGRVKGVGEIVLSAHVDRICMAGQWVVGASSGSYEQRHTFRDRLPCTTAFLSCWRWGHIWCMVWKKYYLLGWPGQDKSLFYQHGKPNEPTKEGTLSFVFSSNSSQFQQ